MKSLRLTLLIAIFGLSFGLMIPATTASAHRSGCHAAHSCPSDSGSYVCGDTGNYSECPAAPTPAPAPVQAVAQPAPAPAPTPAPAPVPAAAPVVTKSSITESKTVPFKNKTKKANKEYVGYKKVLKKGVNGKSRIRYEITLTDGKETGRKQIKTDVISKPVDGLLLIGTRTKSSAKATSVKQPTASSNTYYTNCTEARAAGVTPISSGQPGYRSALDRDSDGIACE